MIIESSIKDVSEGISKAYENWARKTGYEVTDNTRFDCTKIEVSEVIDDFLWKWYKEKTLNENPNLSETDIKSSLAMIFVCYGAKRNKDLEPWQVKLEEGFAKEN
jgi:hypothetical protein